jgi:hypothetical protein
VISDPFAWSPLTRTPSISRDYKIGPIIEFIAASPLLDDLTHSGNLMNDEHLRKTSCVIQLSRLWWVG